MGTRIVKLKHSTHWKDRMAGWALWRVCVSRCQKCGRSPASFTLNGTMRDAERMAADVNHHLCDRCQEE